MNKGFTLVELLAVVIILGALMLIVIISTGPILKNSRSELSEIQIENIENAAEAYYLKEGMDEEDFEDEGFNKCVKVSELLDKGYIDSSVVKNPKDNEEMLGVVVVTYDSQNYTYKYSESVLPKIENASEYPWQTDNGKYISTNKKNSTNSVLTLNFDLVCDAVLTFDWSVSSESVSFDYVYYTIKKDNTTLSGTGTSTKIGGTSYGTVESSLKYLTVTKELDPGSYQLIFNYKKDSSVASGLDRAYVKNLQILYK